MENNKQVLYVTNIEKIEIIKTDRISLITIKHTEAERLCSLRKETIFKERELITKVGGETFIGIPEDYFSKIDELYPKEIDKLCDMYQEYENLLVQQSPPSKIVHAPISAKTRIGDIFPLNYFG